MASLASKVTVGPESPKLLAGTGSDARHLIVVATSERGLAGGFNTNIVRAARVKGGRIARTGQDGSLLPCRPQGPRADPPRSIRAWSPSIMTWRM
jgi:F0F1-type ATP synthase gamma subunit